MSNDPKLGSAKTKSIKNEDLEVIEQNILVVARRMFAEKNYDQVRIEDIASKASVSVSHVMRVFGSKENLFLKAIDQQFKLWDMLQADKEKLGERLIKYVTAPIKESNQLQHVLLFIRGALHSESHKVLREQFDTQFMKPYAKWLSGENAEVRASLITSILFGVTFMHYFCECDAYQDENLKKLHALAAPIIQKLIDGTRA